MWNRRNIKYTTPTVLYINKQHADIYLLTLLIVWVFHLKNYLGFMHLQIFYTCYARLLQNSKFYKPDIAHFTIKLKTTRKIFLTSRFYLILKFPLNYLYMHLVQCFSILFFTITNKFSIVFIIFCCLFTMTWWTKCEKKYAFILQELSNTDL